MKPEHETANNFIGYEYKEIIVSKEMTALYLDCYENFGWAADENLSATNGMHQNILHFKRDRKIVNKMELTRLQRHFEACVQEIEALKKAQTSVATIWALVVGIIGTAFMAGSTFAVTHEPPYILLCIILAIPGFIGWILPYFIYQHVRRKQMQKLQPMIEEKYEEIYSICEKGNALL